MKHNIFKIVLVICVCFITGCGNDEETAASKVNNSGRAVAEELVTRISNGDYENISSLLGPNFFVTEELFQKYLSNEELNIRGNDTIKYLEGESDDYISFFEISRGRKISVKTYEVDGVWYADIAEDVENTFYLKVPVGLDIALEEETNLDSFIIESNVVEEIEFDKITADINFNVYEFKTIYAGTYDLEIILNDNETIEETVYTDASNFNNYNENIEAVKNEDTYYVYMNLESDFADKLVEDYVSTYKDYLTSLNNRSTFDGISSSYSVEFENALEDYNTSLASLTTDKRNYIDYVFNEERVGSVIYVGNDKYLISVELDMDYKYEYSSSYNGTLSVINQYNDFNTEVIVGYSDGQFTVFGGKPFFKMS